jgi:dUTPase
MEIKFKRKHDGVHIPKYATDGSAGFDLRVDSFKTYYQDGNATPRDFTTDPNIPRDGEEIQTMYMFPGSRLLIMCGFKIAIPCGYAMDIRPRSGLALLKGIAVLNSPGTIDSKQN